MFLNLVADFHNRTSIIMASLADVSRQIMRSAQTAPRLDAEAQRDLIAKFQADGDKGALELIASVNLRGAIGIANQFRGYGLSLDDLVQEGAVGILHAARKFDVTRDVPFGAYARMWMKAEVREFVLRNWSIVRLPMQSTEAKMFFRIRQMRAELSRDPDATSLSVTADIAQAFGVDLQDVEIMQARLSQGDFSLNAPVRTDDDDGAEWGDLFAAEVPELGALLDDQQCAADLRQAMAELDDRERMIIQERWLTDEIAPLNALAEWFEITGPAVRKIEVGAIEKLRRFMNAMRSAPRPEYA